MLEIAWAGQYPGTPNCSSAIPEAKTAKSTIIPIANSTSPIYRHFLPF